MISCNTTHRTAAQIGRYGVPIIVAPGTLCASLYFVARHAKITGHWQTRLYGRTLRASRSSSGAPAARSGSATRHGGWRFPSRRLPQHVERRRQVQRFPVPIGGGRMRTDADAGCRQTRVGRRQRRPLPARRRWLRRQRHAVRAQELELPSGVSYHLKALFVHPRGGGTDSRVPSSAAGSPRRRPSAPRGGRRSGGSCSRETGTGYDRGPAGRGAGRSGPRASCDRPRAPRRRRRGAAPRGRHRRKRGGPPPCPRADHLPAR